MTNEVIRGGEVFHKAVVDVYDFDQQGTRTISALDDSSRVGASSFYIFALKKSARFISNSPGILPSIAWRLFSYHLLLQRRH